MDFMAEVASSQYDDFGDRDNVVIELRKRLLEHSSTVEQLWLKHDRLKTTGDYAENGIIAGIVLTFLGFVSWFFRVQMRQDELLSLQLEKAKKEVSKAE